MNLVRISTQQATPADAAGLEDLEYKAAHGVPWERTRIQNEIRAKDNHAIYTTANFQKIGWLLFNIVEGDILVNRFIYIHTEDFLDVLENLFGVICFPSFGNATKVHVKWPEHAVDSPIFQGLRDYGFKGVGVEIDSLTELGRVWDQYLMEVTF